MGPVTGRQSAGQQFVHQVGGGRCLVFAHQPGAVNLDRAVANPHGAADGFGGQALHQVGGHFALSGGEFCGHRSS